MLTDKKLTQYVLLEKTPFNTKVIGIYTHAEALKYKDELVSKLTLKLISFYSYNIQGPFETNNSIKLHNLTEIVNPLSIENNI